jgi:MFS family permease
LAGIGFAGAYMPGLKALTDRLTAGESSRAITFYTSSYSFGVGLSFLVSQVVADHVGWRAAFLVTSLGPLGMIVTCLTLAPSKPAPAAGRLLDFRPVLRNRAALGYVLGYGAHCFELYGMRTWIVAFWTFVVAHNGASALLAPVAVSVLVTLIAMPASILGNEAALRFGRHRAISAVMIASAALVLTIGLCAGLSPYLLLPLVLLHAVSVNGDSGALTSGMTQSAVPTYRGATMALHSTVGFGLSAVGAWAAGIALDVGGGPASASGWTMAFGLLAIGILLGPVALAWSRRAAPGGRTPKSG